MVTENSHFTKYQNTILYKDRVEADRKGLLVSFFSKRAIIDIYLSSINAPYNAPYNNIISNFKQKYYKAYRATREFDENNYDLQTLRIVTTLRLPFYTLDHDKLLRQVYTIRSAPLSQKL